jgi:hypothetical protein
VTLPPVRPSIDDFNRPVMIDPNRLPTLDELRARRKDAMLRATRRLLPMIAVAVLLEAPAIGGFVMVNMGRATFAQALPFIAGSMAASVIWLTALLYTHVKRNVPEELRRAGLVCHVCGEPLVLRPGADGARAVSTDPAIRALFEGRCSACKAVVVRDLPEIAGGLPAQPTLNSSRARA